MTAVYWHSLKFVTAAKSQHTLDRVVTASRKHAANKPLTLIA